ncbi:hypothetical protein H0H93_006607 [Arthromyces matolae]|nr:hypothetical protein H0H93_006607 [Arthromyces matolae]
MDQHNRLQKLNEGVVTVMPVQPTTLGTFKQIKGGSGKDSVRVAPHIPPESPGSDVDFLQSTAILQTAALMAQLVMLHPDETPKEVKKRLYNNTTPRRTLIFPMDKNMLDQIGKEVEMDPEVKVAARVLKSFQHDRQRNSS